MNEMVPIQDIERMATAVAGSGLFGIKTKEQAVALMLIAQAEGLHPAIAARDYHIIEGKPSLKADAMLARFISGGGKVQWHDHTNERVSATFSHPAGGTIKVDWDMVRAKAAGLAGKQNWSKYPRQMLRARVISEGVRAVYPVANSGLYTPEEVQDFTPTNTQPQDMVTIEGEAEVMPPAMPVEQPPSPLEVAISENREIIDAIKMHIENEDYKAAADIWFPLSDAVKKSIWVAPKNGGPFTTEERKIMISTQFREAHFNPDYGIPQEREIANG